MANILIDLGHPGDVHLFRNAARQWQAQGHKVLFTALDREMIVDLVKAYKLPHRVTYKRRKGKLALIMEVLLRTLHTYWIALRFKTDLFVSFGTPTIGFPAWLMRKPYLALTDNDHAQEQNRLFKPFATIIATPSVFTSDLGPKQIIYAGFHELAYLHPDEFTPNPGALTPLDLKPDDTFFVVRFVAWEATHDVGQHGFSLGEKRDMLRELSTHGRVLLSVEGEVDSEFAPFVTNFPPEMIHDLLAFATLYIGEGGTMATDAALLGTPSIFVNTIIAGNWVHLHNHYELLYFYANGREAMDKARELLAMPNLKAVWAQRRSKLLSEKINLTPWIVNMGNRLLSEQS